MEINHNFPCGNAKLGDFLPVEYDAKIKERIDASVRHSVANSG